jgi:hypothetical protein
MQVEKYMTGTNICEKCGTEISSIENKTGCSVCENAYFDKIKESYVQNLNTFNMISRDLFKVYFDMSGESVKSYYAIMGQYLEMEKSLRIYNPYGYYLLTSYQFQRNKFLGNVMQNFSTAYSNFTDIWKTNFSTMSNNLVSTLENMNRFDNIGSEIMHAGERLGPSQNDKNFIKTIGDVNKTYNAYKKEEREIRVNNSENVTRLPKKE